jgi:hypothetical protein
MKKPVLALLVKAKSNRLAIVGAALAASMCVTGIARADSLTGAFYSEYLGPYATLGRDLHTHQRPLSKPVQF